MKKMLIAALLALSASTYAVDTPTPTITPTSTPTPTFTPTPDAVLPPEGSRVIIPAIDIMANDGVVKASAVTTPLPGAAAPWVAQSASMTAAVLSTGSAKARVQFVIPNDFDRSLKLYAYASTTAAAQAITMTINVKRQAFGASSSATASAKVYLGTATSMLTGSWPGLGEANTKVVRALLPAPTCADCKAGDLINVDIRRSGGVTTDLYIYAIEAQYKAKMLRKP